MKRLLLLVMLLIAPAGCVTPPPAEPIGSAQPSGVPAAPVRADQVTAQNAHQMSQALADELDREAQREIGLPKR